ncbi:penicillin-binding protein 2 [Erwinia tracheiphila]|uniref:Peptidoglycan D,D-transpeptidase MrdA n=1 Tax=Erwinia tracheiphila TaxID=65700 RepID=A0A0M2KKE4_9GAMM|nr:penicillin-binding protein 2 [Erwinia tracheiphila]EOS95800.1 penicillin-binding protein 2 [Erwinia tracheiphila PSU-1]KKF37471.1 penicillin-binding protein [Erwinia tracheiphila]UIA88873.1 penicillin-binding protein 2 [Erwinia tracheiphila]UIA97254.1 penicillin-binding protein 2 [Erwinia tracheiphila]
MKFRDFAEEEKLFVRRALVAFGLVLAGFVTLIVNLWHVQIDQNQYYQTRSNQNDIKMIPIAPTRGIIFDRNGIPLVKNVTWYDIEILPYKVQNIKDLLTQLTPVVDLTPDDIENFTHSLHANSRYKPVVLKTELTDEEVARFSVNQYRFAGVNISSYEDRQYPYGPDLAHVIGYVSRINDNDYKHLDKEGIGENYAADHNIGKQGIEGYYESVLHGKTGYQEVEVDNHGRVIRVLKEMPPVAGKNLWLTLDLHLQQYVETQLVGQRAAVLIENPQNGEVLAMVSSPSYDPNPFVKGISYKAYKELLNNKDLPLINRVTQGLYPPASTVKPYMAMSALLTHVITPSTTFFGASTWTLPGTTRKYRDWKKTGHGTLDVTRAIEESADTFFYQVAFMLGIDRIHTMLSQFGYGKPSGIDLNEEYSGLLPSREWKQKVHKKGWYQGDTVSVGIGQGYWIATPIQMVKALDTLINNGRVIQPHLLYQEKQGKNVAPWKQTIPVQQIGDANSPYWGLVRRAMFGMANAPNGTGYKYFHTAPYGIAGKSGTSQVFGLKQNQIYNAKMIPQRLRDHIFYTVFAPFDNPRVAMALILENGGVNGVTAAPLARNILDHIFLPPGVAPMSATADPGSNTTAQ